MIYDTIIVGAGAAGLFAGIHLNKSSKKIILEKNKKAGVKVLLSGGERANVSNMDIDPERDYFTQNKKFLLSIFSRYNQWDIMNFFNENGIEIVEEDRSRLILKSGDSKELLSCLMNKVRQNNCEIHTNCDVKSVIKLKNGDFLVTSLSGKKYTSKNVIISSGGKSFFQVGTTGEGYSIAEKLGIKIITPYRTLCGMSTKKDLSQLSGISTNLNMKLLDMKTNKEVYSEIGPILFTHFGISGPIVHNLSNAVGEYLNKIGLTEKEFETYIVNNLYLDLNFDIENTAKKIVKFFDLHSENNNIKIELQNWRSWKEAKATGGGIDTNELTNLCETKKHKNLYFIGEVVDITGKTGGFNLQWAWSSAFSASTSINRV